MYIFLKIFIANKKRILNIFFEQQIYPIKRSQIFRLLG